jgi:hypothetical protein
MSTTQLMPSNDEVLKRLNARLAELKANSEIAITDQSSFIQSAQVKLDYEQYIRAVEDHFEPELAPAEEKVKRTKLQMSSLIAPVKDWLVRLKVRQQSWQAEEKRLAAMEREREQEKLRAEARQKADAERREAERLAREQREAREKQLEALRKAGEIGKREEARLAKIATEEEAKARVLAAKQAEETAAKVPELKVVPNIPKGAGLPKNQTYYGAEVNDANRLLLEFVFTNDPERRAFLRRFITIDQQEVGKYARDTKNNEKVEATLPGSRAWSKG